MIQRVKRAFILLATELGEYDPSVLLALATRAANVVEDVHGYSPWAWAYGVSGLQDIDSDQFYHRMGLERGDKAH